MDEKKIASEFASIYKALESNSSNLIATNRDLKRFVDIQSGFIKHFNNHIDIFNHNVETSRTFVKKFTKQNKMQNLAIGGCLVGFAYLYKKVKKLEAAAKKE